jgi:hypothetical protein
MITTTINSSISVKPELRLWCFMETVPSADLGAQLPLGEGNAGAVCLFCVK